MVGFQTKLDNEIDSYFLPKKVSYCIEVSNLNSQIRMIYLFKIIMINCNTFHCTEINMSYTKL